MYEQFSSDGFDTSTAPTNRIFVAIFPDADARARIGALPQEQKRAHGPTARPTMLDRSHVKLLP